jgi:glycerophosphoryl diester phosphodiesterase
MSGLTRRQAGLIALAAGLAPNLAPGSALADDAPVPLIFAEGGAAAERPEDTRSAYDLAINEGADFIQANLVATKEGVLIARRDNELSATTDVAARAEFAARKTAKTVDGQSVSGWFSEDFTLPELRTLTCRERLPTLRPQNTKFDGKEPILTIQEVLAIARDGCTRTGRVIGVAPRLLHASYFAGQGLPIDERLADELNTAGYRYPAAAVWVQAFEPSALKGFSRFSRVRRMQVIEADGGPPDGSGVTYAQMITPDGLAAVRAYAEAIAPSQNLVIDPNAAIFPAPTTLVLDAHNAGLSVHCWTARAENMFLPKLLQKGDRRAANFGAIHGDLDKLMVSLFAGGVDSLATDQPAQAVRARTEAINLANRGKPQPRSYDDDQ